MHLEVNMLCVNNFILYFSATARIIEKRNLNWITVLFPKGDKNVIFSAAFLQVRPSRSATPPEVE